MKPWNRRQPTSVAVLDERPTLGGNTDTSEPVDTPNSEAAQKREFFRVPLAVPVRVFTADGCSLSGVTLDLSMGGCAIPMDYQVAEGSSVRLSVDLDDESFETEAEVRNCRRVGSRYKTGLSFTRPSSMVERTIAKIVAAHDRRSSLHAAVATSIEYRRQVSGEIFHSTASTDISLGGIRFTLASQCEIGDRLEMLIMFADERISIQGTVTQIYLDDAGLHAAVCFDPLSTIRHDELMAAIRGFLDEFPRVESDRG